MVMGSQGGSQRWPVSHQRCIQADGINPDRPTRPDFWTGASGAGQRLAAISSSCPEGLQPSQPRPQACSAEQKAPPGGRPG